MGNNDETRGYRASWVLCLSPHARTSNKKDNKKVKHIGVIHIIL
jgi:hypothetical protein